MRSDSASPDQNGADPAGTSVFQRHRALAGRALAPLSVIAIVAVGAAVAPSFAASAPALPAISAQNLLLRISQSKVDAFTGTVGMTTNLGLPALPDQATSGGLNPLTLLTGSHTLQVAANGPDKERIALLGSMSEYDLVHNGDRLWLYDSSQNTVERGTADPSAASGHNRTGVEKSAPENRLPLAPLTPQQAARQLLAAVSPTTNVSVEGTERVAGLAAYTLVVTPKQNGSLIGQISLAVDAANGAVLRVTVYPQHSGTPMFELGFTSVSFGAPADSRFDFTPPKGATVTGLDSGALGAGSGGDATRPDARPLTIGAGWLSVLELHGVDLAELDKAAAGAAGDSGSGSDGSSDNALTSGSSADLLSAALGSGRAVHGAFGSGTLFTTSAVSVLVTTDGRLFVGAVTPAVLEADAAAQGGR
jgi:outer membrane lipoprotein-sorting protein